MIVCRLLSRAGLNVTVPVAASMTGGLVQVQVGGGGGERGKMKW